ncbi:MAG TPA: glycoside hydrolase family 95 protein, partial [Bacilli bacterium]
MGNSDTQIKFRKHVMRMRKPAAKWQDAMPSGNGTLGAMVYGSIQEETIMLNHEAFWYGSITKEIPDLSPFLPEVRKLLSEGKYLEANHLFPDKLQEADYSAANGTFMPGFDLKIYTDCKAAFKEYERVLDFETGQITVTWKDGGTSYQRLLFVSRPDQAVILTLKANKLASITASFCLEKHDLQDALHQNGSPMEFPLHSESRADLEFLTAVNTLTHEEGKQFGAVARVIPRGGTCRIIKGMLHIQDANEITILIKLFAEGEGKEEISRLSKELRHMNTNYDELLERHALKHRELFLRAELELGEVQGREAVNEQLLLDAYSGEVPAALMERMFDYGRYLLMSSSLPGGLPANLQGVWNGDYAPPWSSAFFLNENIQMNYWQALQGNMP